MSSQGKVRFGVFELDLGTGELRKSGTRLRLQEQPFQVLKALVERPGEVVTREELQQRLWPDDTFVDFEDGLSTAVKKIRRALGDSAANPRFVETLPKRGYRFVAPVTGGVARQRRRPLWPWVAAAGGVVALAVVYATSRESRPTIPWEPVAFTTYPGEETNPTFSPDGERVAFQWRHEGECDIYVKLVGSESRQRLTDHPGEDSHPAWSPDGKQIAFFREHEGEWSLRLIPSIGGVESELARGPTGRISFPGSGAIAWHPGGKWIAYAAWGEDSRREVFAVSIQSGERRPLTNPPPASMGDSRVAFSPDGRELLFHRKLTNLRSEIRRMSVTPDLPSAGESVRVPVVEEFMTRWVWMPNGREIVGQPRRRASLARLELREGARARSLGIGRDAGSVAYSKSARRLVYSVNRWDNNIWALDVRKTRGGGQPRVVVAATSQDQQGDFSPDGSRIAFWSDRTGHPEVWVCDADGANPRQLTHWKGTGVSIPTWSPDGKQIVFGSSRDGDFDLYSIPADGGQPRRILAGPGDEQRGVYSANMDVLFFNSIRGPGGPVECYQMPAGGGDPAQLTNGGGSRCRPSPDGAYLYYSPWASPGAERALWRKPLGGGKATQLAPALAAVHAFAVWRGGVYYIAAPDEDGFARLYSLDPETGEERELAALDSTRRPRYLATPEDGSRVIWTQREIASADLMLVEGFE